MSQSRYNLDSIWIEHLIISLFRAVTPMLRPAAVTPATVDDTLLHSESSRLQASSIVTPCSCYAVWLTSRLQASSIGQLILRIVKLAGRLLSGGWQAGRLQWLWCTATSIPLHPGFDIPVCVRLGLASASMWFLCSVISFSQIYRLRKKFLQFRTSCSQHRQNGL